MIQLRQDTQMEQQATLENTCVKSVDAFPRTSDGALPVMGVQRGLEERAAVVRHS